MRVTDVLSKNQLLILGRELGLLVYVGWSHQWLRSLQATKSLLALWLQTTSLPHFLNVLLDADRRNNVSLDSGVVVWIVNLLLLVEAEYLLLVTWGLDDFDLVLILWAGRVWLGKNHRLLLLHRKTIVAWSPWVAISLCNYDVWVFDNKVVSWAKIELESWLEVICRVRCCLHMELLLK